MKTKLALISSVFLLTLTVNAQSVSSPLPSEKLSVKEIEELTTEVTSTELDELMPIFNLDVFAYYQLTEYNSELKKATYKKTPEYSKQLNELKELKAEKQNQYYRIDINDFKSGYVFGGENKYDMSKKGFKMFVGKVNSNQGRPPKTFYVEFKTLPTIKKSNGDSYSDPTAYDEYLFMSTDETTGLKFENNYDDLNIYLIFKLGDIQTRKVDMMGMAIYEKHFVSNSVQVFAFNESNDEVYFSKNYLPAK